MLTRLVSSHFDSFQVTVHCARCATLPAPSPIVSGAFDIIFAAPIALNTFQLDPVVLLASWLSILMLRVHFDSKLVLLIPGSYPVNFVTIHNVFAVPNVLDNSQLL